MNDSFYWYSRKATLIKSRGNYYSIPRRSSYMSILSWLRFYENKRKRMIFLSDFYGVKRLSCCIVSISIWQRWSHRWYTLFPLSKFCLYIAICPRKFISHSKNTQTDTQKYRWNGGLHSWCRTWTQDSSCYSKWEFATLEQNTERKWGNSSSTKSYQACR